MKIVDVKVDMFRAKSWLGTAEDGHQIPGREREIAHPLIRIITDEGAEGYHIPYQQLIPTERFALPGKASAASPGKPPEPDPKHDPIQGVVEKVIKPLLIGEDPMAREKIHNKLWVMQRSSKRLTDRLVCFIDLALWDLAGRALNQPVYKLLGGHRTKVKAYASTMVGDDIEGGLNSPEAFADYAESCRKRGYQAFKLHTWAERTWTASTIAASPDPKRDIAACRAVRERVGDGMDLMLDPYHFYTREQALYLGRELEKLNFVWLEEPMDEYSMSSYIWLAERLDIPVIGPEVYKGKLASRAEWIVRKASDICRAGVMNVGGLTPLMKVVGLCEAFGVRLELHSPGPGNLHAMAAMTIPGEYYERGLLHPFLDYDHVPEWLHSSVEYMDDEGYVHVPDKPGLGWDIHFDYIRDHRLGK